MLTRHFFEIVTVMARWWAIVLAFTGVFVIHTKGAAEGCWLWVVVSICLFISIIAEWFADEVPKTNTKGEG